MVLEVRDWRVAGLVLVWPAAIDAYQTANVSAALGLLVALAWRHRDRPIIAGTALGLTMALKCFLWPVAAWYAVTRRVAAAAIAVVLACASLLLVTPFISIPDYRRLVGNLSDTFDEQSYTRFACSRASASPTRPHEASRSRSASWSSPSPGGARASPSPLRPRSSCRHRLAALLRGARGAAWRLVSAAPPGVGAPSGSGSCRAPTTAARGR